MIEIKIFRFLFFHWMTLHASVSVKLSKSKGSKSRKYRFQRVYWWFFVKKLMFHRFVAILSMLHCIVLHFTWPFKWYLVWRFADIHCLSCCTFHWQRNKAHICFGSLDDIWMKKKNTIQSMYGQLITSEHILNKISENVCLFSIFHGINFQINNHILYQYEWNY